MFALILTLLISGCGGGGGTSSANNITSTPSNSQPSREYYSLTTARYPGNIITRDNILFWSEQSLTPINKVSVLDGQPPVALASSIGVVKDYLIAGQYIYWIDNQSSKFSKCFIKRSSLDGSTSTILYQCDTSSWTGVTVLYADANDLYWVESVANPNGGTTTSTTQQIKRMPLVGGNSQLVYSTDNTVTYLAGDDACLYWTETTLAMNAQNSLHKISKDSSGHQVLLSNQKSFTAKPLIVGNTVFLAMITGTVNGNEVYSLASLPKSGGTLQLHYSYSDYWMNGHTIRELTADSASIYWTEYSSVKKIPISGGTAVTLVSAAPFNAYVGYSGITLLGDQVFFTDGKYIRSVPSAGGSVATRATLHFWAGRIRSDQSSVYWDESGNDAMTTVCIAKLTPPGLSTGTVVTGISSSRYPFTIDNGSVFIADGETLKKVSITGGRIDVVLEGDPFKIINNVYTDGTSIYFLVQQQLKKMSQTTGIVETLANGLICDNVGNNNDSLFNGRYLYCVDAGSYGSGNKFFRVSLDSGAVSQIASNIGYVSDWTTDGTNLFYSNQDSGVVYRVSVSGGVVSKMFTTNGFDITKLASDGQYLYWINQTRFAKTEIASGNTENIYLGLTGSANEIKVDANNIYWSVSGLNDGRINLATPK